MFQHRFVRKHEIGLQFKRGDLVRVLRPGSYWLPGRLFGHDVEVFDALETRFQHRLVDLLIEEPDLAALVEVVDLRDDQRAFLWKDGRLATILGPGRHVFWKHLCSIEVEVAELGSARLEHDRLDAILAHPSASAHLRAIELAPGERVLFFRGGELIDTVDSGPVVFWKPLSGLTWSSVDLREQRAEVSGQEIMTADKVTLRVNLLVAYRVVDAHRAVTEVDDYAQVLYREAQLALRKTVGTRTLDELLADKDVVGREVGAALASRASGFGVAVASVGLRDVILPGDMKSILNQVIEAEKRAEANLVRRREETAAARSQANTARLLASNPVLARMKELEAVQEILAGSKATFVFGSTDVVRQVRDLTRAEGEAANGGA